MPEQSEARPISFRLYLITDEDSGRDPARVAAALAGAAPGEVAVQLRARSLGGRALLAAARALRRITADAGCALLVNDRLDVALAAEADGVHLPVAGLPPAAARRLAPALLVGASTHSLAEAERARAGGADLVTFGPVFATPSKIGLGQPVGLDALAQACAAIALPVFALGGIDFERAADCTAAGARLACIRAVLAAADPAAAVARLLALAAPPPAVTEAAADPH